ncbi:hypothetical protein HAX54_021404 [Datura stramonium]|uniref:Uncharacterized protein n=1 Tax=Datura stramonium TaxID=4076 RepID=A0ABS8USV0_DATST|nr:hypothetical protein [Datura stramonium]
MANQDLTTMVNELYNHVAGGVPYNNYYVAVSFDIFENGGLNPIPAATNVAMQEGNAQQQEQQDFNAHIPQPAAVTQNVAPPPVVNLDVLSEELRDDWRPFDGSTFDFVSASQRGRSLPVTLCSSKLPAPLTQTLTRDSTPTPNPIQSRGRELNWG